MTTQEVADRLIEVFNQGKATEAIKELYDENCISHEQDGTINQGIEKLVENSTSPSTYAETYYFNAVLALVNQDTFLVRYEFAARKKDEQNFKDTEYGFYQVSDGKVVEEYFYAEPEILLDAKPEQS